MRTKGITLLVLLFTGFISGVLIIGCGGHSKHHQENPEESTEEISQGLVNMPAGFQLVNAHGMVQVDESYVNLALVAKGVVSIPAGGIGGIHAAPQIHYPGISPILCIRPVNTYAFIRRVMKSGSTYSYVINGGFAGAMNGSPLAETFSWYIFDRMSQVPASNSGLQVFNASGELTFSSNSRPMRVVTAGQIPNAPLRTTPAVVNAGKYGVYAACMTQGRMDGQAMINNQGAMFKEGIKIDSNGAVTVAAFDFMTSVYGLATSDSGGQILLVDVSGL
jgi:hypothetical protein